MKILFISPGNYPDYQCDSLFHGLRCLLGDSVVDVNKIPYIYKTFPQDERIKLYGKGFSLYGLLDDVEVDREDVENKIRTRYFDLVVYGSVWRCQDFLPLVFESYSPGEIIFVDGEDYPKILLPFLTRGIYFKRELYSENRWVYPIHLAMPEEKFVKDIASLEKTNFFAPCNPTDRTTYVYETEESYYKQYQESFYGVTMKKAGWDCLRHYEIISQGCAPYFYEIYDCPYLTMHRFPRYEVLKLMAIADDYFREGNFDLQGYITNLECLYAYAKKHLTTIALAKYLIDTWKQSQ
ncbi:MAG: hypothetical protein NZ901_07670 [Geminocystis sp.]|nr:hypothetical protein [Geminocystis sp.]MCS7148050.1 hypothetical protein [Geminocystis sp.]MDW8116402.1 hypothetical protein [Geminocystis sp.]MDW8462113.1 hypothetical protein [Geminocystis sp.]